jgi:D-alanine transaminase
MARPCTPAALRAMHEELIARNRLAEGRIYMQVTRGVAERDFAYPKGVPTTLMAFTQTASLVANPNAETGVPIISIPDIRWRRRDIKSIALLAQCMGKQQAVAAGAYEAWMHEEGFVTEGTSSSAYIVKEGRIITRPLSTAILPGVTRRALLRLSQEERIPLEERPFTLAEAHAAEEAFMTSAGSLVLPIVAIDGRPVGTGRPGPLARRLRSLYLASVRG